MGITDVRLANLGLSGKPFESPEAVVGGLGAMQSQDFPAATWAVAQRCGADAATVRRAFDDGSFLRTHVLRPTWHFVPASRIRSVVALTAPRVHALSAHYYRKLDLDGAVFSQADKILVDQLAGGRHRTRKELAAILAGHGIIGDNLRIGYILMHAELELLVCSGAMKGKQQTYALVDERVPDVPTLSTEDALADLTRRYFSSHGPATVKDFGWWSSLSTKDIRTGLEIVGDALVSETIDGRTYYSAAAQPPSKSAPPPPPPPPSPTAHVLQAYDEYVMGYSDSRFLLDESGLAAPAMKDEMSFIHIVVLDGQAVGAWRRVVSRGEVNVQVRLFQPLKKAQIAALTRAVNAYASHLAIPATLTITT